MIDDVAESKLKQILAEIFELDSSTIGDTTSIENVELWDSLQHFSMVLSVEQEFGVRFSDEEIGELLSYDRLRSALAGKLRTNGDSALRELPPKGR
jgi:acyl carrier protein